MLGEERGYERDYRFVWEGSVGPEIYPEPLYEFPVQSKSDFSTTKPLRGYDNRKEDWPKCMHGEEIGRASCRERVFGRV